MPRLYPERAPVFACKGGELSGLRMQWILIQGADGKKFLGMHWERTDRGRTECFLTWKRPICSLGLLSPEFPTKNSGFAGQDFRSLLQSREEKEVL
jgi:hypothetical protein